METQAKTMKEKALIVFLFMAGILMVSYGMIKDNNLIFSVGLMFVIGGYLIIRKKMKASIQDRS